MKMLKNLVLLVMVVFLGACSSYGYYSTSRNVFRADGKTSPSFTLAKDFPPGTYTVTLSTESGDAYRVRMTPGETATFFGAPALDSGTLYLTIDGDKEEVLIDVEAEGKAMPDADPVNGKVDMDYSLS